MSKTKLPPFKVIKSSVIKQPKDERDYIFQGKPIEMPEKYINPNIGEIENQLNTGSCVANATCSSLEMTYDGIIDLSRLFVYYNAREPYPNLKGKDHGAYIRDGFKSIKNLGVCEEQYWDFIVSKVNTKPNIQAYNKAEKHKITKYERISTKGKKLINQVKQAVLNNQPVVFGMELKESFYNLVQPLQEQHYTGEGKSVGGHAMSVVGYDDEMGFIIENSWSTKWGDNGLGVLTYDFFADNVFDIWTASPLIKTKSEKEDKLAICDKILAFFKDLFNDL